MIFLIWGSTTDWKIQFSVYWWALYVFRYSYGLHIGFTMWPIMVCMTENTVPHSYDFTIFLADIPHLNNQINIKECFDTIVNIRGGHARGHQDLHIRFSNLLWLNLQIGNFWRYNKDILYISLSKVQWCVHGQWIHMQRSNELNIIITSVFWFNPACSIYIKDIMMIFLSTIVPS